MLVDGHLYNVVFSAVMSVLTNLIMIIVVSHSQKLTFAYRGQLYVAASISLFYTSVNVFVNPVSFTAGLFIYFFSTLDDSSNT